MSVVTALSILKFPRPRLRPRRVLILLAAIAGLLIAALGVSNLYVLLSTNGESTSDVSQVRHANAALVLGAYVKPDGSMSTMLADRVSQAAALWHAGKVDRVLVSGDHKSWTYDEPGTMRKALVRDGVPASRVFEDHAGLNTWNSVVRARKVFGARSVVVVTQGFHMSRALYLAKEAGLKASGLTSDLHPYGIQGQKSELRELLSRVKAVASTTVGTDVLLGPSISADGSGRVSWGPKPPPNTPPAGSPGR